MVLPFYTSTEYLNVGTAVVERGGSESAQSRHVYRMGGRVIRVDGNVQGKLQLDKKKKNMSAIPELFVDKGDTTILHSSTTYRRRGLGVGAGCPEVYLDSFQFVHHQGSVETGEKIK